MQKETLSKIIQFIKFGIVGFTNNVIFYLVNVGVLLLLKNKNLEYDYMAANIAAFLISVLWSFYWNNKFVFVKKEGESRSIGKALLKTYLSYAFSGIVLNNALSYFFINYMGISKFVAPLINLFLTVPINFLLNKLWAFKCEKPAEERNDSSIG